MYDNLSAMNAFAGGMATSAHNIANISTSNFNAWDYHYGAGAASNVQLQVDPTPTQIANPNHVPPPPPMQNPVVDEAQGLTTNTVDLAREFTNQIYAERAFETNAIAITTRSEMEQTLYNQVHGPSMISYRV